jgi:drug/metabolite transporter (DMT)-like permease
MSWLFITISAYFLTAVNSITDKFLLRKSIPNPLAYSFYVGIFSAFVLILIPFFGLKWPGFFHFFAALSVGVVYLFALIAFFYALKKDEASRVVPLVGAVTPFFILIISHIFSVESFSVNDSFVFVFLLSGGFLISYKKEAHCGILEFKKNSCLRGLEISILASLFFAIFFVSAKYVFTYQDFMSGFIFTRLGSFVAALLLLFIPVYRRSIHKTTKKVNRGAGILFIFNKTLAGFAFLLINYAIAVGGSPTLVNALEGTKYMFVLVIALILSLKFPKILKEQISTHHLVQKGAAIALIFFGIFLLFE